MGDVSVCFQIDTDNKENFPSSTAFCAFKKQRDSFYDILRIWEENHLVPGWTFQIALAGKIHTMLTLHNDTTNYCHFARLFKSQLLISSLQKSQQEGELDNESLSVLKSLKRLNPVKLTKLTKRLVTPLPSEDNSLGPSFPGVQEFFKDFILHAFNPIFYTHLENCFVYEIMEMNDTHFANSEIEDSETMVDEQTRKNFATCLSSLRVLGKMLGLLISLPYRSEIHPTQEIIATQVEIRGKVVPSLNLEACLQKAVVHGKLSLTIPWVVKYLATMDTTSLQLPYYSRILEWLYCIYWILDHCDVSAPDSLVSQRTSILLKSTLNWLFGLPNFPQDAYLTWKNTCKTQELKSFRHIDKYYIEKTATPLAESNLATPAKCKLDKLDIIDDRLLRTYCPLTELKVHAKKLNLDTGSTSKHITPVSSPLHGSNASLSIKQLELQLEEAFFHGQPASTRKTVDFVSERVASACVKHICNTLLLSSREKNIEDFRSIMIERKIEKESYPNEQILEDSNVKVTLKQEMNILATNVSKELKEQCERVIPPICQTRITKSIDSLLAEDTLIPVKDTCVKIARRMATNRINQWIQSHIVDGALFVKDMEVEMARFFRNNSPVYNVPQKTHNPDCPNPSDITNELRSLIWDLMENNGKSTTANKVSSTLDKLYQCLKERADFVVDHMKVVYCLCTDVVLFLVAYKVDAFTDKLQDKFIKMWTTTDFEVFKYESPVSRLLSPRNVMLIAQVDKSETWSTFGKFLKKLLDKDIISINTLSNQCIALLRHEWPVPVLKYLSKCLTEATARYNASSEDAEQVKYLLGWIAEAYSDMEIPDDYSSTD